MKVFCTCICFIYGYVAVAQNCNASAGTKTLYKPQQHTYTKAPSGYKPVFINHVGRHGARHLTKDVNTTTAYKLLVKADSVHALKEEGKRLKKMVLLLQHIEAPGLKSISEEGKKELEGIAGRMAGSYKSILDQTPLNINVKITKEVRTSQSADAFLNKLKQNITRPVITRSIDDTALRFYDLSPAYLQFEEKGNWKEIMAKQFALNALPIFKNFTDKFFITEFHLSPNDEENFYKDVYGFLTIIPSISYEAEQAGIDLSNLDFRSFFSCAQLTELSRLDEAEDFLLKGPGEDTMGIQVKIAVPLLVQFIKTSDELILGSKTPLQLRFAHAETIAPFAALMQISSASRRVGKMSNFKKFWNAAEIIPLSANIQWLFYQNESAGDYLVKFLLNEKEVSIKGLSSKKYPYYDWKEVRQFYLEVLHKSGAGLTDNMNTFLHNIRRL